VDFSLHGFLANTYILHVLVVLNAFTAGYIMVTAVKDINIKIGRYVLFTIGVLFAIAVGAVFKIPFMDLLLNPESEFRVPNYVTDPDVASAWLYAGGILGIIALANAIKSQDYISPQLSRILDYISPQLLRILSVVVAIWAIVVIYSGIKEFADYATKIAFFGICFYSGMAYAITYLVDPDQRTNKKIANVAGGLIFVALSLNAFTNYQIFSVTSYQEAGGGWEGGITTKQDELKN
tara:strand:- start:1235 stop:1942 length:708 start_codon:yes stop_codon:yes gene_type:complete